MKLKKLVFVLIVTLLLVGNTVEPARANGAPLPTCGEYVANGSADYTTPIYSFEFSNGFRNVIIESYNGWEIVGITIRYDGNTRSAGIGIGPGEETYKEIRFISEIDWLTVRLQKDCGQQGTPNFTGRYVYTLFGNYSCNLLTTDESIPARFLNPAYRAPLCDLPGQAHNWSGDWVKNKEMEVEGYFYGGPSYDTRPVILP